jgi:hypothetical protein
VRATKAYIASLGTTGVLIASSLLLLAIVSALVAFRGWPELGAAQGAAPGLLIEETRAPVGVATLEVGGDARELARSGDGGADRTTDSDGEVAPDGSTPGGSNPEPRGVPEGQSQPGGGRGEGGTTVTGAAPVPEVDSPLPGGTTDNVRNGLSDLTDGVSKGVGDTVGGVNPNLGAPLTGVGEEINTTLDQTLPKSGAEPLPGVGVKLP